MHWINAVAIFIMIGSGWKIYNDEVIFGWLHFPDAITVGDWAQHGAAMAFLRHVDFRAQRPRLSRLWPCDRAFPPHAACRSRCSELLATINETLRFRLAHDDLTKYNAVQKLLYIGIICVGIMIVISGLAIWKPVQFSELASLFDGFQTRGSCISSAWPRSSVSSSCMWRWRCWCRTRSSPWSPAGPRSDAAPRRAEPRRPRGTTMSIRTPSPIRLPARKAGSIRTCLRTTGSCSRTSTGARCCAAPSASAR